MLTRYSFDRLDALNGYAAGMPSPRFHDLLFATALAGSEEPFSETARSILVDLGRRTREEQLAVAVSVADEIGALEQAERLADLRGHPGPLREDVLDAVRSCFVKGAIDVEGTVILGLVHDALAGNEIGDVPQGAFVVPIVEDFRKRSAACRISVDDSTAKTVHLQLYRKAAHRTTSRLFHQLAFLEVPFASLLAGPDFRLGHAVERVEEVWEHAWSPLTESTLIERSVEGPTVQDAAVTRLRDRVRCLDESGEGRSASAAVTALVHACQMGLHDEATSIAALVGTHVSEDPDVGSLVQALVQLLLLEQSREPLEAHRLAEIPALALATYRRACGVLPDHRGARDEDGVKVVRALAGLRDSLQGLDPEAGFDPELLWIPLERFLDDPRASPLIVGGAVGLLWSSRRIEQGEVGRQVAGHLGGTRGSFADRTSFLRGLLGTCRETAWRMPAILEALDRLFSGWDREDFAKALPELRLAFADLTPREIDRVAKLVARLHGEEDLGELVHRDLDAEQVARNLDVDRTVIELLERDGLGDWT